MLITQSMTFRPPVAGIRMTRSGDVNAPPALQLGRVLAGEKLLRSSVIWTDRGMDTGPLLMVSEAVKIELPEPLETLAADKEKLLNVAEEHQQKLKEKGDWVIFPETLEMIARGRFALDEKNRVYVDRQPVPDGYRKGGGASDGKG